MLLNTFLFFPPLWRNRFLSNFRYWINHNIWCKQIRVWVFAFDRQPLCNWCTDISEADLLDIHAPESSSRISFDGWDIPCISTTLSRPVWTHLCDRHLHPSSSATTHGESIPWVVVGEDSRKPSCVSTKLVGWKIQKQVSWLFLLSGISCGAIWFHEVSHRRYRFFRFWVLDKLPELGANPRQKLDSSVSTSTSSFTILRNLHETFDCKNFDVLTISSICKSRVWICKYNNLHLPTKINWAHGCWEYPVGFHNTNGESHLYELRNELYYSICNGLFQFDSITHFSFLMRANWNHSKE